MKLGTLQHGEHWAQDSYWLWPGETRTYQYTFTGITEDTDCKATIKYWNGNDYVIHDEEWITIQVINPVDVYLAEAITCDWVNGFNNHGPAKTFFNPGDPLNHEAGEQYFRAQKKFEQKANAWTKKYAMD